METTYFGDTRSAHDRLGWYVSKKLARLSLNATFIKVVLYTILFFGALIMFTSWQTHRVENQIANQQKINLDTYKDVNGFMRVHKNY